MNPRDLRLLTSINLRRTRVTDFLVSLADRIPRGSPVTPLAQRATDLGRQAIAAVRVALEDATKIGTAQHACDAFEDAVERLRLALDALTPPN